MMKYIYILIALSLSASGLASQSLTVEHLSLEQAKTVALTIIKSPQAMETIAFKENVHQNTFANSAPSAKSIFAFQTKPNETTWQSLLSEAVMNGRFEKGDAAWIFKVYYSVPYDSLSKYGFETGRIGYFRSQNNEQGPTSQLLIIFKLSGITARFKNGQLNMDFIKTGIKSKGKGGILSAYPIKNNWIPQYEWTA